MHMNNSLIMRFEHRDNMLCCVCVCVLSVSCSPHHLLHSLSIAANNFKAKGDYICALGFVQCFFIVYCIYDTDHIEWREEKIKKNCSFEISAILNYRFIRFSKFISFTIRSRARTTAFFFGPISRSFVCWRPAIEMGAKCLIDLETLCRISNSTMIVWILLLLSSSMQTSRNIKSGYRQRERPCKKNWMGNHWYKDARNIAKW